MGEWQYWNILVLRVHHLPQELWGPHQFCKVTLHPPNLSFNRSIKLDKWKAKDLKHMELGGNKNARIYYEENDMFENGKPNHKAPQLAKYK